MKLNNIVELEFGEKMEPRVLSVDKMIEKSYEPKRENLWVLFLEGMDHFFVKSADRPKFHRRQDEWLVDNMEFEFYDPIAPSGSHQIYEWIKTENKRKAKLVMLDPIGSIVEEWDFKGLELIFVDYGNLNYSNKGAATIKILCKCEDAKLLQ